MRNFALKILRRKKSRNSATKTHRHSKKSKIFIEKRSGAAEMKNFTLHN